MVAAISYARPLKAAGPKVEPPFRTRRPPPRAAAAPQNPARGRGAARPATPATGLTGPKVGRASGAVAAIVRPVGPGAACPPPTRRRTAAVAKVGTVMVSGGRVLAGYTVAATPAARSVAVAGTPPFAVA